MGYIILQNTWKIIYLFISFSFLTKLLETIHISHHRLTSLGMLLWFPLCFLSSTNILYINIQNFAIKLIKYNLINAIQAGTTSCMHLNIRFGFSEETNLYYDILYKTYSLQLFLLSHFYQQQHLNLSASSNPIDLNISQLLTSTQAFYSKYLEFLDFNKCCKINSLIKKEC